MTEIIDSINQLSPKAKMELVAFLQPWFAQIKPKGVSGGNGWQFGGAPPFTYGPDNEGGWGLVVFNDHQEMPNIGEGGALFEDRSTEGLYLSSIAPPDGPPQSVVGIKPNEITLSASIGGYGNGISISDQIFARAPLHNHSLKAAASTWQVTDRLGNKILEVVENGTVGGGGTVTCYDHNGNKLMEIRDDGTLHIKTGATWVADL